MRSMNCLPKFTAGKNHQKFEDNKFQISATAPCYLQRLRRRWYQPAVDRHLRR